MKHVTARLKRVHSMLYNFFRPHHIFYVSHRVMFDLEAASKNTSHIVAKISSHTKRLAVIGSSSSTNQSTIKPVSQKGEGAFTATLKKVISYLGMRTRTMNGFVTRIEKTTRPCQGWKALRNKTVSQLLYMWR